MATTVSRVFKCGESHARTKMSFLGGHAPDGRQGQRDQKNTGRITEPVFEFDNGTLMLVLMDFEFRIKIVTPLTRNICKSTKQHKHRSP